MPKASVQFTSTGGCLSGAGGARPLVSEHAPTAQGSAFADYAMRSQRSTRSTLRTNLSRVE